MTATGVAITCPELRFRSAVRFSRCFSSGQKHQTEVMPIETDKASHQSHRALPPRFSRKQFFLKIPQPIFSWWLRIRPAIFWPWFGSPNLFSKSTIGASPLEVTGQCQDKTTIPRWGVYIGNYQPASVSGQTVTQAAERQDWLVTNHSTACFYHESRHV